MKRYFFHIREQELLIIDNEGTELPDLAAATHEAIASARELVVFSGTLPIGGSMEICDVDGNLLRAISIADVFHMP
ncbi:MAG: hypothetical protein JWR75_1447 [Devosia sp.]|nr:hypothetical protein [Devosia sp.]